LDRSEVERFAATCPKDPTLVAAAAKKQLKETIAARQKELADVTQELAGIDERKIFLTQRRAELEEYLTTNNAPLVPGKTAGRKRKGT
jgi:hypothetical protein